MVELCAGVSTTAFPRPNLNCLTFPYSALYLFGLCTRISTHRVTYVSALAMSSKSDDLQPQRCHLGEEVATMYVRHRHLAGQRLVLY